MKKQILISSPSPRVPPIYAGELRRGRYGLYALVGLIILAASAMNTIAQLWTPAETNTVELWYDASDTNTILTSGSSVTNWLDKSGNGKHLDIVNNTLTTGRSINGLNSVDFTPSCSIYTTNSHALQGSPAMTIACVVIYDVNNNDKDVAFTLGYGWDDGPMYIGGGLDGYRMGANGYWERYGAVSTATPLIQIGTKPSGGNYVDCQMYINGTESAATALSQSKFHKPNVRSGITIGTYPASGIGKMNASLDGAVGEIVACKDSSTDLRATLEGYLAHKWGLEDNLPESHLYKKFPPGFLQGTLIIIR